MKKTVKEALDEIQANPERAADYKDSAMLKLLFDYMYSPSKRFLLPEGVPPYKEETCPFNMSPGNFQQNLKKLYIFTRVDLTPTRRESIFIQMLESVHATEAKILLAIKNQDLSKLYPVLTHEFAYANGLTNIPPDVNISEFEKKDAVVAETKSLETNMEPKAAIELTKPKVKGKPGPKPGWLKRKIEESIRMAQK